MSLPNRLARYLTELECAAAAFGLPVEILAAIMDRESLGGDALSPPGPAGTGDGGHGRGLMQIDDRAFKDWCALLDPADGLPLWTKPAANTLKGAEVLSDAYAALKTLPAAVCAYNAGVGAAFHALGRVVGSGHDPVPELDLVTTGKNYVSDVLRRARGFGWTGK